MKLELNKSQKRSERSEKKLVSNQGPSYFCLFVCFVLFSSFSFLFFSFLLCGYSKTIIVKANLINIHKNKVILTVGEELMLSAQK